MVKRLFLWSNRNQTYHLFFQTHFYMTHICSLVSIPHHSSIDGSNNSSTDNKINQLMWMKSNLITFTIFIQAAWLLTVASYFMSGWKLLPVEVEWK